MDEKENEIIEGVEINADTSSYTSNEEPMISDDSEEEAKEQPEAVYAFRWDYSDQFEHDKRANNKNKASKRGAVVYGLIMLTVFVVAFAILAVSISLDKLGQNNVMSNVELTVPQIVEVGLPSSVSILSASEELGLSSGSGFVVNDYGYIVTNYHVIENSYQVVVTDNSGKQYSAEVVGYNASLDLALLYAEGSNLKSAVLADSDQLKLGETVVAIGSPTGSGTSLAVSNGIVSAVDRQVSSSSSGMIQTNAPLNPGNSGGPLFDSKGSVVGIVTAKLTYTTDSEGEKIPLDGISYAIPINAAKTYIDSWITKDLQKPMLGITAVPVTAGEIYFYDGEEGIIYGYEESKGIKYKVNAAGVKTPLSDAELNNENNGIIDAKATGIYVINVTKGLGAYGKLQKGDIVTGLGGMKIENVNDAREIFQQFSAGDTVAVEFYRNGQVTSSDMTLKTKGDMLAADRNS